jgi:hypothetical protein
MYGSEYNYRLKEAIIAMLGKPDEYGYKPSTQDVANEIKTTAELKAIQNDHRLSKGQKELITKYYGENQSAPSKGTPKFYGVDSGMRVGAQFENIKGIKTMTLTKDVLKRIIKEELEKLTADMATEEEDSVDSEIAELEKQLAEAKKAKAMKKMKGAHADHKMKPLKSKK